MKIIPVFILFSTLLFGQTGQTLDLYDCIRLSLQNDYVLQSSEQQAQSEKANWQSAKSEDKPRVSLSLSHDQLFYAPYNYRQQNALLHLDWQPGNWLEKAAESENLQWQAGQLTTQNVKLSAIQKTIRFFLQLRQSDSQLALLHSRQALLMKHKQLTEALWQSGIRTRLDVLQSDAALFELDQTIRVAQAGKEKIQSALALILGFENSTSFNIVPADSIAELPPNLPAVSVAGHPLLQIFDLRDAAMRRRTAKINAALYPQLDVYGGYQADGDPTAEGNYWLTGVGVQLPLFQWNQSSYQKQRITSAADALQSEKRAALRELQTQLENFRRDYAAQRDILDLQNKQISELGQAVEMASAHYEAGQITNLEYLTLQQQLTALQIAMGETRLHIRQTLYDAFLLAARPEKIDPRLAELFNENIKE